MQIILRPEVSENNSCSGPVLARRFIPGIDFSKFFFHRDWMAGSYAMKSQSSPNQRRSEWSEGDVKLDVTVGGSYNLIHMSVPPWTELSLSCGFREKRRTRFMSYPLLSTCHFLSSNKHFATCWNDSLIGLKRLLFKSKFMKGAQRIDFFATCRLKTVFWIYNSKARYSILRVFVFNFWFNHHWPEFGSRQVAECFGRRGIHSAICPFKSFSNTIDFDDDYGQFRNHVGGVFRGSSPLQSVKFRRVQNWNTNGRRGRARQ